MVDHQKLGRQLFLAVLDAGDKRAKIQAACAPILDGLSAEDRGRVEGHAFVLAMSTLSSARKAHPAAASIVRHARGVVVGELFASGGARRG